MLEYLLIGMGIALSAGLQPGPLQVFYLTKVADVGWRRTLPAAFAPLISDGPIALVALLLLRFLPSSFQVYLQLAGGLLLLVLAWRAAFGRQGDSESDQEDKGSAPRTVLEAALVNLLNPNPYLGWSLIMGPYLLKAWGEGPGLAVTLLLSFYITLISISVLLIILMGTTEFLDQRGRRMLTVIAAAVLAGLGFYYLVSGGITLAGS